MAWSTPMTATVGAVFTAAQWNQHARDNLLYLYGARTVKTSAQDVVNTTTETDLFAGAFTIAAGAMETDRQCDIYAEGTILNNSGATRAGTFKVKVGSTVVYEDTVTGIGAGAALLPWWLKIRFSNLGAANVNNLMCELSIGAGAATTGIGDIGSSGGGWLSPTTFGSNDSTAFDTATSKLMEATVTWPVANANLSWKLKYGRMKLV